MNQLDRLLHIDLSAEPGDVDVDHIVQRRRPGRLLPHLTRQSFARDNLALMSEQIFQQLELANCQIDGLPSAADLSRHEVEIEIPHPGTRFGTRPCDDQGSDWPSLRKREGLHQVVVGSAIQPGNPIFQRVTRRKDEHRSLDASLAQGPQNLKPIAAGKHQVQKNDVERLRIQPKEGALTSALDHHVVPLPLETLSQGIGNFLFVFDNKHTHQAVSWSWPVPVSGHSGQWSVDDTVLSNEIAPTDLDQLYQDYSHLRSSAANPVLTAFPTKRPLEFQDGPSLSVAERYLLALGPATGQLSGNRTLRRSLEQQRQEMFCGVPHVEPYTMFYAIKSCCSNVIEVEVTLVPRRFQRRASTAEVELAQRSRRQFGLDDLKARKLGAAVSAAELSVLAGRMFGRSRSCC